MSALHESILAYRGRRYLWLAVGTCAAVLTAYAIHDPPEPPNGGTWLGYALGTIGAVLILSLLAFGVRKRSYASRLGKVQGWLSAHVYLGVSLLVIVTLHTGFQFGWNVHTLAYALMCLVIASGAAGTVFYLRNPARMNANRAGTNRELMLLAITDLDEKAARIAKAMPPEFGELVASNRDRTVLGGGPLALLAGADRSRVVLPSHSPLPVANAGQHATLAWLGDRLARNTDGALGPRIQDLLTLVGARKAAVDQLRRDLKLQAWLDIWLFFHVPVSFALLAALAAHVVAVFVYW
jgi:hypothetical protein